MHQLYLCLTAVFLVSVAWSACTTFGGFSSYRDTSTEARSKSESGALIAQDAFGSDLLEVERSLRLDQYSQHLHPDRPRNITIYLGKKYRGAGAIVNPAYSIFHTDVLSRYGSGRVDYIIHDNIICGDECIHQEALHPSPCLLVSRGRECKPHIMECQFPQCKQMITNDETCRYGAPDVREYYSKYLPGKGYLPLGMRMDTWESFQKRQLHTEFYLRPASDRKYAFNAIFSKSTNAARHDVANIIEEHKAASNMTTFVSIADQWHAHANSPRTPQIYTDDYVDALLDSVFTLCPAGHNPECFRLFEAVEAGTIPIVSRSDLFVGILGKRQCRDSLHHWHEAPIIVLDSWRHLYPTVEKLIADPEKLNDMQITLREWYDKYMKAVIRDFEDFMLEAHEENVKKMEASE